MVKSCDVSIIIVNHNSGKYLKETIEALVEKTKDMSYEIILVDNNSSAGDESVQFITQELSNYPFITLVKSDITSGFGEANNKGIKISNGRNILILNPDIVFHNNVAKILSDYLDENSAVGIVGPKVLNYDGTFQASCMRGEPDPVAVFFHLSKLKFLNKHPKFYSFSMENKKTDELQEIIGLSGCCMMVKRKLLEEVGVFDERFFLYQEDTDLCYRAHKSGWKLIYNPEAVLTHYQGVTTRKDYVKNTYRFCQSTMRFFKKHYWERYNLFQKMLWTILIWGNFVVKLFKGI